MALEHYQFIKGISDFNMLGIKFLNSYTLTGYLS